MISDEDVKQLYIKSRRILEEHWEPYKPSNTQIYRGQGPLMVQNNRLVSCKRHMAVFNKFNIIPKFCFDCYKVVITPGNIIELFKLMMVFEKLDLPNDNTRKTLVEARQNISGTYTGLIYCLGITEAREVLQIAQNAVSDKISDDIKVTLKRGCSEYALAFPRYAKVTQGATAMKYKKKWKKYEDLADEKMVFDKTQPPRRGTFNRPDFTPREAHAMSTWLTYAATIGDLSYKKISGCDLQPDPSMERPEPFHPDF